MHYYSFNIGDYASHTQRLSLLEDLAYRRMLDAYYLGERPLNGCTADVAREIGMLDHMEAVQYVLDKFFKRTETGFSNVRCDEEIAHYHDKQSKASNAGRASAQRRLEKKSTSVEKTSTDEQPTNNHKPINNISISATPDGFAEFYSAYPKKVGRPAAEKAFRQAKINGHLPDVLDDIERRLSTGEWSIDKRQFIPNPATYLNQRRWEDEPSGESKVVSMFAGAI